jgi:hypothetical protein
MYASRRALNLQSTLPFLLCLVACDSERRPDANESVEPQRVYDGAVAREEEAGSACWAVRDGTSLEPIPGARLTLAPLWLDAVPSDDEPWPPVPVGDATQAVTDERGCYGLPAGADPQRSAGETTWWRVDVSADGYRTRRFYRTDLESLTIEREDADGERLPDMVLDSRTLRDWQLVKGTQCLDITSAYGVEDPLARTCLRFSAGTANTGEGDLRITARVQTMDAPLQHIDDGQGGERLVDVGGAFINHVEHGHVHVDHWLRAGLRKIDSRCADAAHATDCPLVGESKKISFCLADSAVYDESLTRPDSTAFVCGVAPDGNLITQGISAGSEDVYSSSYPGQGIDVTGMSPGAYWLEAEVNPGRIVEEESYDNNLARVRIELSLPTCGDGIAMSGEVCDGEDLLGESCESLRRGYTSGQLACADDCHFDASSCERSACGDSDLGSALGKVVASGSNREADDTWSGQRCAVGSSGREVTHRWTAPSAGTFVFDTLGSDYDTVLYALRDDCDGPELACNDNAMIEDGATRGSRIALELVKGQTVILVVDAVEATGDYVLDIEPGGRCGNGVREGHEQCDGADRGGIECRALGFGHGDLSCTPECLFDTARCVPAVCGDGVAEPLAGPNHSGEQCDGADLLAARCDQSRTYSGGTLACNEDCELDFSACIARQ